MKKWMRVMIILLIIAVLLIAGSYMYVEISYNKAFAKNGMLNNCCPCEGMEMFDICCDCEEPSTFLEKINYLNQINSMR